MSIRARVRVTRGGFRLNVNLEIPGRGITALFGRSGSGKTTLLRCLAGLERFPDVTLEVNGECWQKPGFFLPVHRRPLGYVFQEASLFDHLDVRRNLTYGHRRIPDVARQVDFDETVQLLGLAELLSRHPGELSGGQRQRVAIGRALLTSPSLLLMDEPMASLDDASKAEILPYLERLHRTLATPVVYVSHSLEEVSRLADHLALLEEGRLLAQGPIDELLTRADLPLAHSDNAAAMIEATVVRHEPDVHLTELTSRAGSLRIPHLNADIGQPLRLRVAARDVVLALTPPRDASVLNCLPARVAAISDDPHPGHVLVQLDAGGQTLIARITRHSCQRLELAAGVTVHALVKAVSLK